MPVAFVPRGNVPPGEEASFLKHVCPPTFSGGPLDPVPATVNISRNLMVGFDLLLPPGVLPGQDRLQMHIIEDPDAPSEERRTFPSRAIRTRQGDVVHATVGAQTNTHTIHWHGIDPSPMNDGVGHTSFELTSSFIYQFATHQAGTYIFHCHKNTVLHFELGMYGLLIVDPPQGPGFVAGFNPPGHVIPYDVEAFWVPDEMDSRWHELGHNAYMQSCDANDPAGPGTFTQDGLLNDFRPDVFVITGVPQVDAQSTAPPPITDPRVAVSARVGQTILIRLVHAGYTVQQYTIGLDARVIATDGYPLGTTPFTQYSSPFTIRAGTPFRLTSAMRYDLIIRPTQPGTFPAQVEFFDWVNGVKYATARTTITVSP